MLLDGLTVSVVGVVFVFLFLGLLVGVDDAEAMKHIQGRFMSEDSENDDD